MLCILGAPTKVTLHPRRPHEDDHDQQTNITPRSSIRSIDFFNESQNSVASHGQHDRGAVFGLDLNFETCEFPHLQSYSEYLQPTSDQLQPATGDNIGEVAGVKRRVSDPTCSKGNTSRARGVAERRAISTGQAAASAGGIGRARGVAERHAVFTGHAAASARGTGRARGVTETHATSTANAAAIIWGTTRGRGAPAGGTRGGFRLPPTVPRGGSAVRRGGTVGQSSSSHSATTLSDAHPDEDADLNEEEEGNAVGSEDNCDKAVWNANHTFIFCDICVEEIDDGNSRSGFLTSRAYNNMVEKYFISTGLRHSKTQLKNRWNQLKKLYTFWLYVNKQTGNGTVYDDDVFWEKHTKGKNEWKRLRHGPPEYLDQLEKMFASSAVDGSTSCIPEDRDCDASPMRTTSTETCDTSPVKKGKSPMVKIMKGFVENFLATNVIANKAMSGELMVESIKKAMALVVDCGAAEGSAEHFVATKILRKPSTRAMFFTLTTKEGRFAWLQRWCKDKNID